MKMVEKQVDISEKEVIPFFNKVDWQPLFDFVKKEYNIVGPVTLTPNPKSRSFSIVWKENVADRCGLIGTAFSKAYLRDFGSGFFQYVSYDEDKKQEYLQKKQYNISWEDVDAVFGDIQMWCDINIWYHLKDGDSLGRGVTLFQAKYSKKNGWSFDKSF